MSYLKGDKIVYRPHVTSNHLNEGTIRAVMSPGMFLVDVVGFGDPQIINHQEILGKVVRMSDLKPGAREMTTAYDLVYRRVILNPNNQLQGESLDALLALVDFANSYERGFLSIIDALADVADAFHLMLKSAPVDMMYDFVAVGRWVDAALMTLNLTVEKEATIFERLEVLLKAAQR